METAITCSVLFKTIRKFGAMVLNRIPPIFAWLLSLFVVTYPIFDADLYWHLANGRAMVAARRIINEEVFSYTHFGDSFVNHEWLSQILFYTLWDSIGPYGLFVFKMLLSSFVVFFIYRTARVVGGTPWVSTLLTVLSVLAGIQQYHIRPELFSLLNMAILGFILYSYRIQRISSRLLWIIPVVFVAWDWLHGAVFGLTFFTIFVAGENLKSLIPVFRQRSSLETVGLRRLNICYALTMAAVILNPYGIRSYEHFLVLALGNRGAGSIIELQPMWHALGDSFPFMLMVVWALALFVVRYRTIDITELLLVLAFGGGALRYSRLAGVAAIVLVPVIARYVALALVDEKSGAARRIHVMALLATGLVVATVGFNEKIVKRAGSVSPNGTYVFPSETAFGYSVNELYTPAGSVRFIKEMGLQGNMYNNANLGGYLSFYLAPERRIFQYNMPPIFGDVTRFVRNPSSLDKWHVDYALAGSTGELTKLFPSSGWARVFNDYVTTLVVRRTLRNKDLINEYEIRYFTPEQSLQEFNLILRNSEASFRLAFEMGVYLSYMKDERIAERWMQLLTKYPGLANHQRIQQLGEMVAERNGSFRAIQQ